MSRFLDHWKLTDEVASLLPARTAPEVSTDTQPVQESYRGATVWIHPQSGVDEFFVTDDHGTRFDVDNALDNVLLERYVPPPVASAKQAILKNAYYLLKPLMPRSLQLRAQRVNARAQLRKIAYPGWPHDDTLLRFLGSALGRLMESAGVDETPFIGYWPRGHLWAACFTHDVETVDGLSAMGKMAGIEEAHDIRSTWFVVPERYPVSVSSFETHVENGHEIGIHGLNHDGKLFSSRSEFERRAARINRYIEEWQVVGFRSPALYRHPEWIPELDIRYDSSYMDTAVMEPQPGGVSTVLPFHLDDRVVELPITMPMDHHLINILQMDAVEPMLSKFRWVVERHGLANFLYHPDYNLDRDSLASYREVVASVVGTTGGWVATAAQIADWWDRRRRSTLVTGDNGIRIEGPAAEDGAVWYAKRDGGFRIEPL